MYMNKKDPFSKVTPQSKSYITGLYDYFLTVMPNMLYKTNSFPSDFAENTILSAFCAEGRKTQSFCAT